MKKVQIARADVDGTCTIARLEADYKKRLRSRSSYFGIALAQLAGGFKGTNRGVFSAQSYRKRPLFALKTGFFEGFCLQIST
jgi:hypothetical protein